MTYFRVRNCHSAGNGNAEDMLTSISVKSLPPRIFHGTLQDFVSPIFKNCIMPGVHIGHKAKRDNVACGIRAIVSERIKHGINERVFIVDTSKLPRDFPCFQSGSDYFPRLVKTLLFFFSTTSLILQPFSFLPHGATSLH